MEKFSHALWFWPDVDTALSAKKVRMYGFWASLFTGIATLLMILISLNRTDGFNGARSSGWTFLSPIVMFAVAIGIYKYIRLSAYVALIWHVAGKVYQIAIFPDTIDRFNIIIFFFILWCFIMSIRAVNSFHSHAHPMVQDSFVQATPDSPSESISQASLDSIKQGEAQVPSDSGDRSQPRLQIIQKYKGWYRVWVVLSACSIAWALYQGYGTHDRIQTYRNSVNTYSTILNSTLIEIDQKQYKLDQHREIIKKDNLYWDEHSKLIASLRDSKNWFNENQGYQSESRKELANASEEFTTSIYIGIGAPIGIALVIFLYLWISSGFKQGRV